MKKILLILIIGLSTFRLLPRDVCAPDVLRTRDEAGRICGSRCPTSWNGNWIGIETRNGHPCRGRGTCGCN